MAQLICSSLIMALIAGVIEQPWMLPVPSGRTVLAMVGLAALSTALAYAIFFRILAVSGPTNVMLVTLLIPISGVALGHLVLGEAVLWRHIIGALVIASGLLVIDGRVLALLRRQVA